MTPAARSSYPATALNFTSTKPSRMLVSLLIATGKVARPDCLSKFGLLGAVGSASTVRFGFPFPVILKIHPSGDLPAGALSKFKVSAMAFPHINKASMEHRARAQSIYQEEFLSRVRTFSHKVLPRGQADSRET